MSLRKAASDLLLGEHFTTCLTKRHGVCVRPEDFIGVRVALGLVDGYQPSAADLDLQQVEVKNISPSVIVEAR